MTGRQLPLNPRVKHALGKVSPSLAKAQLEAMVTQALEVYPAQADDLFREMDSPKDPDQLVVYLADSDPRELLRQLLYINPEMDLQDIPHLPVMKVLRAILEIFQSDYQPSSQA
jgi:hypothetical protein